MTERLYYKDCYLTEFDGVIIDSREVDGKVHTRLNHSAFYPTSGGQSHDRGLLGDTTIVDVVENDDGDVIHVTDETVGSVGETLHGSIDADYRREQRQKHTAQHILSSVLANEYDLKTVSVHLGDDYCGVEVPSEKVADETLLDVEIRSNRIVLDNHRVDILILDGEEARKLPTRKPIEREGEVRIINIGNFEYSACGGTHCRTTAEVGLIKVIGTDRLRGNTLIKFLSGDLALIDYRQRFDVTDRLSRDLTCGVDDLPDRFEKLTAANKDLKQDLEKLRRRLLPIQAEELSQDIEQLGRVTFRFAELPDDQAASLNQLAPMIAERTGGVAAVYSSKRIIIASAPSSGIPSGEIVRQLCTGLGLRGGGNERMAQIGALEKADLDKTVTLLKDLLRRA